MGLRTSTNPRPESLGSNVPGLAEGNFINLEELQRDLPGLDDDGDLVSQLKQFIAPSAVAAEPPAQELTREQVLISAGLRKPVEGEVSLGTTSIKPRLSNEAQSIISNPSVQQKLNSLIRDFESRFKTSFSTHEESKIGFLKKKYGDKNVWVENGEIFFREKGDKKGRKFDPSEFSARDLPLDLADFSGDIVEAVVAGLTEAGTAASLGLGGAVSGGGAGALAGAAIGGTLGILGGGAGVAAGAGLGGAVGGIAGMGLGAASGLALSGGAGAVSGETVRRSIFNLMGGNEKILDLESSGKTAALGAAFSVLSPVVTRPFKAAYDSIVEAFVNPEIKTLKQTAVLMKSVDDLARQYDYKFIGPQAPIGKSGKTLFGAIEAERELQGKTIGLFKDQARRKVGNKFFPTTNYTKLLKEELENANIMFDQASGKAYRWKDTTVSRGGLDFTISKADVEKTIYDTPGSSSVLDELIERYNLEIEEFNKFGGRTLDSIHKMTDQESRAAYNAYVEHKTKDIGSKSHLYRKLSGALSDDRRDIISNALNWNLNDPKNLSPSAQMYLEANSRFRNIVEDVEEFKDLFNGTKVSKNGESFIYEIAKARHPEAIDKIKFIIGEDNPAWAQTQASYIDSVFKKSRDPVYGILDVMKFKKHFDDLGDELRRHFIDDSNYRKLSKYARDYEALSLKGADADKRLKAANSLISAIFPAKIASFAPAYRAMAMYRLLQSDADLAVKMIDNGYLDIAQEAIDERTKSAILKEQKIYSFLVNQSKRIGGEKAGEMARLVPSSTVRQLLRNMIFDGSLRDENDYIGPVDNTKITFERTGDPRLDAILEYQEKKGFE